MPVKYCLCYNPTFYKLMVTGCSSLIQRKLTPTEHTKDTFIYLVGCKHTMAELLAVHSKSFLKSPPSAVQPLTINCHLRRLTFHPRRSALLRLLQVQGFLLRNTVDVYRVMVMREELSLVYCCTAGPQSPKDDLTNVFNQLNLICTSLSNPGGSFEG